MIEKIMNSMDIPIHKILKFVPDQDKEPRDNKSLQKILDDRNENYTNYEIYMTILSILIKRGF